MPSLDVQWTADSSGLAPAGVRDGVAAVATGLSAVGGLGVLLMTRWGIGTSPDSVHYLQAARQMVGEAGASGASLAAGAQHAPLYALVLAVPAFAGIEPLTAARWLNVLLFALNIFLVGFMVRSGSGAPSKLWVLASALLCGAIPSLSIHAVALSEPLFVTLCLVGIYLLARYVEESSDACLVAAAALMGLGLLTRYAGAACIITAGVALMLESKPTGRRLRNLLLFAAVSGLPLLAWLIAGMATTGTVSSRTFAFHPVGRAHLWQALYTMSGWLLIPASAPDVFRLAIWPAIAAAVGGTLLRRHAAGPRPRLPLVRLLVMFIAIYALFLAVSISFFDANTPLDDRILFPVFAAGVIVLLDVVDRARSGAGWQPLAARVAGALLGAFVLAHAIKGAELVATSYETGWGLSSLTWRRSATLEQVRRLPEGTTIYSNGPEAIYLHAGRASRGLPRTRFLMNGQPNKDFQNDMLRLDRELHAACGVVVYFRRLAGEQSLPSEAEIRALLSVRPQVDPTDGVILASRGCPR